MDGGVSREFRFRMVDDEAEGCAYIVDGRTICGTVRRPGSSYCAQHHALCHVADGSFWDRRRLKEEEALAAAVGGRRGRPARLPPERFLNRLENIARGVSRPKRSCIVPGGK
ncbi:MAG TPA: hypothetical protein VFC56_13470 [Stellaceae bacterium]|nr:hypothetical protein [Stellaceae bacterium]